VRKSKHHLVVLDNAVNVPFWKEKKRICQNIKEKLEISLQLKDLTIVANNN